MRTACIAAAALSLISVASAHAQRQFRIAPIYSTLNLQDLSGASHGFSSWGGSAAVLTADAGESGVTIARYDDLSTDGRVRRMTLYSLDARYYPVGSRGVVAPFAGSMVGLARVGESSSLCLPLACSDTVTTTSNFAFSYGLGLRVNVGSQIAGQDLNDLEPPPSKGDSCKFLAPRFRRSRPWPMPRSCLVRRARANSSPAP